MTHYKPAKPTTMGGKSSHRLKEAADQRASSDERNDAAAPPKVDEFPKTQAMTVKVFNDVSARRTIIRSFPAETLSAIDQKTREGDMAFIDLTLGQRLFVYEMLNSAVTNPKKPSPSDELLLDKTVLVQMLLGIVHKLPQDVAEKVLIDNDGAEQMITADPNSALDVLAALEVKTGRRAFKSLMGHEPFQVTLVMAGIEPSSITRRVAKGNSQGPRGMD